MSDLFSIVLAAGKGTRMKSELPKVLHKISGKPMLGHVVDLLKEINSSQIFVVVGHQAELVKASLGEGINYVEQREQLGTGHAVLQVRSELFNKSGITLVISGDTPLLTNDTTIELINEHKKSMAAVTILTADLEVPTGYGRIISNDKKEVVKIVEEKDATIEEKIIKEINTGIYCFDNEKLFKALLSVEKNNSQGEYYLTDVIEILHSQGEVVSAYKTPDYTETIGINDRFVLAEAENIFRKRILKRHMYNGVTIIDPESTFIDQDVVIVNDTTIFPGTLLRGKTFVGRNCVIGPNADIIDTSIGDEVTVSHSVINSSVIGNKVTIGPFAYIRPDSYIKDSVKIGDFVEIKNTTIGQRTKVPHHSYIGDAILGEDINIGCGTITVNYDGQKKHQTKIEDGVFVGCNSNLIAPVTLGKQSYIAAGSTITNDVPDSALAIARERQVNKESYGSKIRDKKANNS